MHNLIYGLWVFSFYKKLIVFRLRCSTDLSNAIKKYQLQTFKECDCWWTLLYRFICIYRSYYSRWVCLTQDGRNWFTPVSIICGRHAKMKAKWWANLIWYCISEWKRNNPITIFFTTIIVYWDLIANRIVRYQPFPPPSIGKYHWSENRSIPRAWHLHVRASQKTS